MHRRSTGAIALLFLACAGARTVPSQPTRVAVPLQTLELSSPAAGMCRDGGGLLLLEASGTRMLRLSDSLVPFDTVPLTERVAAPRGCASDRYYIYVYDDDQLYRMTRKDEKLYNWLGNVRVAGLASYSTGEMLVSDSRLGAIIYKTVFQSSREFVRASEIPRPGAMTGAGTRFYGVLSANEKLVLIDQAGIQAEKYPVPKGSDLITADDAGICYVAKSGVPVLWCVRTSGLVGYELGRGVSPTAIVWTPSGMAVLDAGNRVRVYEIED